MTKIAPGICYCAMKKSDGNVYIFTWEDGRHLEVIQRGCDFADNPELLFTWKDATRLAQRVRQQAAAARSAQQAKENRRA